MGLRSLLGQRPLPLALACAVFLRRAARCETPRAAHAQFKLRRLQRSLGKRLPAAAAKLLGSDRQTVSHRDAFIKHKTFALPQAVFWRHGLQVFQDTAFEMKDVIEALGPQQRG